MSTRKNVRALKLRKFYIQIVQEDTEKIFSCYLCATYKKLQVVNNTRLTAVLLVGPEGFEPSTP